MLEQAPCKRCGKIVTTTAHSLLGLEALKRKWGIICQSCATPEERQQVLEEQGKALSGKGE